MQRGEIMASKIVQFFGKPIEFSKELPGAIWLALFAVFVLLPIFVVVMMYAMREHKTQTDFDNHLAATPAGKMALQMYGQCMESGGIFGNAPTSAACVVQTVNAARVMSGEQFATDVSAALKTKLSAPKN